MSSLFPSVSIAEGMPVATALHVTAPPVAVTPHEAPKTLPPSAAASALSHLSGMWSRGLSEVVARSVASHPMRIVIMDNSGSMRSGDGKLIIHHHSTFKTLGCTRWSELVEDVSAIAKMSDALKCRTDFHLLNPAPGFSTASIGAAAWSGGIKPLGRKVDVSELTGALAGVSPSGSTPLTEAVMQIVSMIQPVAQRLRSDGQAVAVLICTDGLPNDQTSFVQAMRQLQALPVWCVVRLVTDDDGVVEYWNDLDASLEAPLEVLDDVKGEAREVCQRNPWLTYAPPLHLARLFGLPDKLFDALDEAPLLPAQIKAFLQMLLGCDTLPEPELDTHAFLDSVKVALQDQPPAYDPRSGKLKPWVDVHALERSLRRGTRCAPSGSCAVM